MEMNFTECVYQGISFRRCIRSITVKDVRSFEKKVGFKLPEDYVQFLVEANGGVPNSCTYIALPETDVAMLDALMGIGRERGFSLEFGVDEFSDVLPENSIIIGRDPGGNAFLLVQNPEAGGIYFWDRGGLIAASDDDSNLYFVAETFTEFLSRLRPSQEEAEADLQKFTIPERILAESDGNEPDRPPSPEDDLKKLLEKEPSLEQRLILVGQHFLQQLDFASPLDAASAGFILTLPISQWEESDTKFIHTRTERMTTDPEVVKIVSNGPFASMLYYLLWGYLLGQYSGNKLTDREFAYSTEPLLAALRSLIPKLSQ